MSEESASEAYAPECLNSGEQQQSCRRYRKRIQKSYENSIEGKWTEEENVKYALFMDFHSKIFLSKEKRKSARIFKSLSKFLGTRTPRQCRSHFQKIIGKFKSVKKVKIHYQDLLGALQYQQQFDIVSRQLESDSSVKMEEGESSKIVSSQNVQVQTDPLQVAITDLSESELRKFYDVVRRTMQTQPQIPYWMPPALHFPFPFNP